MAWHGVEGEDEIDGCVSSHTRFFSPDRVEHP